MNSTFTHHLDSKVSQVVARASNRASGVGPSTRDHTSLSAPVTLTACAHNQQYNASVMYATNHFHPCNLTLGIQFSPAILSSHETHLASVVYTSRTV